MVELFMNSDSDVTNELTKLQVSGRIETDVASA